MSTNSLSAATKPQPTGGVIQFRLFDFVGQAIEGLECKVFRMGHELGCITTDAQGALPDLPVANPLDIYELWVRRFGRDDFKKVGEVQGGHTKRIVAVKSGKQKITMQTRPSAENHVVKVVSPGVLQKSGRQWVQQFVGSTGVSDLTPEFAARFVAFKAALEEAAIGVRITATYRPPERSYMMYWAQEIACGRVSPDKVPPFVAEVKGHGPVLIDWAHWDAQGNADLAAAKLAATDMRNAFGITGDRPVGKPYQSNHNKRQAVDMRLTPDWGIGMTVKDKGGNPQYIKTKVQLFGIGQTYGVIHWDLRPNKNAKVDDIHWSITGG